MTVTLLSLMVCSLRYFHLPSKTLWRSGLWSHASRLAAHPAVVFCFSGRICNILMHYHVYGRHTWNGSCSCRQIHGQVGQLPPAGRKILRHHSSLFEQMPFICLGSKGSAFQGDSTCATGTHGPAVILSVRCSMSRVRSWIGLWCRWNQFPNPSSMVSPLTAVWTIFKACDVLGFWWILLVCWQRQRHAMAINVDGGWVSWEIWLSPNRTKSMKWDSASRHFMNYH